MTRPIGTGTTNVAVNFAFEERFIIGNFAKSRGISIGELLRQAVRLRIAKADPEEAKRLARVRRDRRRSVAALSMIGLTVWQACLGVDMRRPASGVRVMQGARAATRAGRRME